MIPHSDSSAIPAARGARRPGKVPLFLVFSCFAAVGLLQTGCRSGGCPGCPIGAKLSNGVQSLGARVFNHRDKGCSTCGLPGTAVEEGVVVDGGVPVLTPGAVAVPAPGTIVAPPAIESDPQLQALPAPAATSSRGANTGPNRSAYEAARPKNELLASKRGADLSRAYQPAAPSQAKYVPEEPDILDGLPPVELSPDTTRKVVPIESKPAAGPADGPPKIGEPAPAPAAADPPILPGDENLPQATSAESNSAGGLGVDGVRRTSTVALKLCPGIDRAATVGPQVAGGSLPSADGLAWLKEKGFRTVVDLRPREQVDAAFPDLVLDHGMTYVPLPFAAGPINPARLARFSEVVGQADQRPLYFFDADGRRAGLAWYLRARSVDQESAASARAKAEEIGLQASDVAVADQFLQGYVAPKSASNRASGTRLTWGQVQPARVVAASHVAPPAQVPVAAPVAPPVATPPPVLASQAPVAPVASVASPTMPAPVPTPSPVVAPAPVVARAGSPTDDRPLGSRDVPFDRGASWKPVAALVLSGLGVPLAYWSRSSLNQRRAPRRASLTAKGPGPRKALPSSDA